MTVFGMVRVAAGRVFQLNVNLGVDARHQRDQPCLVRHRRLNPVAGETRRSVRPPPRGSDGDG